MTINIIAKHKDATPIVTDDITELVVFCDMTFGMKNDDEYWFQHFTTDRNAIYSMAEDVDESLDVKRFDEYTEEHPEMSVYVEYVID